MKITIEQPLDGEEEIIFRCHEIDAEMMKLITKLKTPKTLAVYEGSVIHQVVPKEIYYCEVVDNCTFIYMADYMYECTHRLYELEEKLGSEFIRISKSTVINTMHIKSLRPGINGRFEALLNNGETTIVSRQYVVLLKEYLGIKKG